jgi:manganese oxidase
VPDSAQWPDATTDVPVGAVRVLDFVADAPGDWAFHCHKSHHTMNAMGHKVKNFIGLPESALGKALSQVAPDAMTMGTNGMAEMASMSMPLPSNTLPMMTGTGPFGGIEMGGMFTVVKVREGLAANDYGDPGWYQHPPGTVAHEVETEAAGEPSRQVHGSPPETGDIPEMAPGHHHQR